MDTFTQFFHTLATTTPSFATVIILIATKGLPIIVVLIGVYIMWFHEEKNKNALQLLSNRFHELFPVIFVVIFAWLFALALQNFIALPRPFVADETLIPLFTYGGHNTFPSGHTTVLFALATIMYFFSRRAGVLTALGALIVACARVIAGVHYPLDIFGGIIMGVLLALIARKLCIHFRLWPHTLS
jgi:membrane-associated phospholipid phosphatase